MNHIRLEVIFQSQAFFTSEASLVFMREWIKGFATNYSIQTLVKLMKNLPRTPSFYKASHYEEIAVLDLLNLRLVFINGVCSLMKN